VGENALYNILDWLKNGLLRRAVGDFETPHHQATLAIFAEFEINRID